MTGEVYSSRTGLQAHPLEEADWPLCADGSPSVDEGHREAAYAAVTLRGVLQAKALPPGAFAQKTELITLTRALD